MDRMPAMPGAKAPGPATPGMGTGNVPFAPGLINGRNLGQQTNPAPLAREAAGGITLNLNTPPTSPENSGPSLSPTPPQGMPQSIIGPEMYLKVLDTYMNALLESVQTNKPLVGGIY